MNRRGEYSTLQCEDGSVPEVHALKLDDEPLRNAGGKKVGKKRQQKNAESPSVDQRTARCIRAERNKDGSRAEKAMALQRPEDTDQFFRWRPAHQRRQSILDSDGEVEDA